MDKEYYLELARVRMMRAEELLEESKELLQRESYKSANNRAFYAIEKGLKALLATEEIEVTTHSGALKQFNFIFIFKGDGIFTSEDYQKVAKAEQIRNISDYDDFYIASKEEARQQVEAADYMVAKIANYIHEKYRED